MSSWGKLLHCWKNTFQNSLANEERRPMEKARGSNAKHDRLCGDDNGYYKVIDIERLFALADQNVLCNTAYPYQKTVFRKYISEEDLFRDTREMSFYVHVPFCRHLCSFCEYTRFPSGNIMDEKKYIQLLKDQIELFLRGHHITMIYGLDVGGGTPTALENEQFEDLLQISRTLEEAAPKSEDFEKSIEISFSTISKAKLQLIGEYEFKRVSAGLQTSDQRLLERSGRAVTKVKEIKEIIDFAHGCGIEKINLDLMYGLPGQNDGAIDMTIDEIQALLPEQVTVYETRYNLGKTAPAEITREKQYDQYSRLFDGLTGLGYEGRFGANTFSRCGDAGMSSYIRNRMQNGIPYKGFGISAQSMSRSGISYGVLKNAQKFDAQAISDLTEGDNYMLPPEEIAAKYVSVALYGGCFRLQVLENILQQNAEEYYHNELRFLTQRRYAEIEDGTVTLTEAGFRYYGAIAALFWSAEQKQCLLS